MEVWMTKIDKNDAGVRDVDNYAKVNNSLVVNDQNR
jgi:hypothetical protein